MWFIVVYFPFLIIFYICISQNIPYTNIVVYTELVSKLNLVTVVEGDQKAPFSIATTVV